MKTISYEHVQRRAIGQYDIELKRNQSEWQLVVKRMYKTDNIAYFINQKSQSVGAKVKSQIFIGVIKNIPTAYNAETVKACVSGCERAE